MCSWLCFRFKNEFLKKVRLKVLQNKIHQRNVFQEDLLLICTIISGCRAQGISYNRVTLCAIIAIFCNSITKGAFTNDVSTRGGRGG